MAQLKMYWFPDTPIEEVALPEGYSFSHFDPAKDIHAWCDCLRGGALIDGRSDGVGFGQEIIDFPDINPAQDIQFLDYKGEHIGTATAFVHKAANIGDMHQVALRKDFRGKGLAKYLSYIVLKTLKERGVRFVSLTTGEGRPAAVRSYLAAGFRPVQYDVGMEDRWAVFMERYEIDSLPMYYEDGTFYKTIYRKSRQPKVKIGVFGAGRGRTMMNFCKAAGTAELVAVCDAVQAKLDDVKRDFGQEHEVALYTDFDEFLRHDMDCVVLANFANEHAPYAIRCMEAGKNVLSEVLPVQTMKEAVALVECVERTGKIYAYAENYAYMPAPRKMRQLYKEGKLGDFEYGEGEYMHNCEPIWDRCTGGDPTHWRNTMSAFYYCTHSLGPLIHITGMRPVKVSGFEVPFDKRMCRMGAKAGPIGAELVTLENGAVLKSIHGVGPSKCSIWYSVYGSLGELESAREITGKGVGTLYGNLDKTEGGNEGKNEEISTKDGLTELAEASGHGGSDYYVMYNMVEALRGSKIAEIVDVYEAMDMFLPGMFAYYSALEGGKPMEIPNLRNKEERDKWRNDRRCTDPKNPENEILPSYSKGNPEIPAENYERWKMKS